MQYPVQQTIATIYKTEYGKVLASLVRLLGDFDLAEEALQETFSVALEKWPLEGIPKNPSAWLISTGKFKAIDTIRRTNRLKEFIAEDFNLNDKTEPEQPVWEKHVVELNRAIAVGMQNGPEAGLSLINNLHQASKLDAYHLIHAVRADFSKKLGLKNEAVMAYQKAIELARQEPERRYLQQQLDEILK